MSVTVQTIGVWYRWRFPEALRSQLRLAHDLREDLVTLQLRHEVTLKAIWSSFPQVAATEDALSAAETALNLAAEAAAAERARQRTKRITGPVVEQLAAARIAAKHARAARREAIGAVRADATEQLSAASGELKASQKRLYEQYSFRVIPWIGERVTGDRGR